MKRYTETCKWDDPWFRSLNSVEKLVFLYVIDRCNNAGFWEIDEDSMAFHTKLTPEQISGAWQGLNRGLVAAKGWIWVRRFLRHQKNEALNPENNAHKQIIMFLEEQLERFGEVSEFRASTAPYQPLFRGTGKGTNSVQEKRVQREKPTKATSADLEAYAVKRGFPASDGAHFFDTCETSGWKLKGGNFIKDPLAHFRTYQSNGWLQSQKNGSTPVKKMHSAADYE